MKNTNKQTPTRQVVRASSATSTLAPNPNADAAPDFFSMTQKRWGIATMFLTALAVVVPYHQVVKNEFPIHGSFFNQPLADVVQLFAIQVLGLLAVLAVAFLSRKGKLRVYAEHYTLLVCATLVLATLTTKGLDAKLNARPADAQQLAHWFTTVDECAVSEAHHIIETGGIITGSLAGQISAMCENNRRIDDWNKVQRLALVAR